MPDIDYKQFAQALLAELGTKHKDVPSATPNAVMGHGAGGLFSHHALEKPIFSAMVLPVTGLHAALPVRPALTTNPLYGIFTGVTATTGDEPTGPCDDPPYAGLSKLCMHQFVFGRYSRMTRVFELDAFGKLQDRADHLDLQLMNNPFGGSNPFVPTIPNMTNPVGNDIAKGLFEFAVAWARDFARQIYQGSPTNNTANNGYMEFYGLDTLINTGYRDAITGVACPAADSYIESFGDLDVASNCEVAVDRVTWIMHHLRDISSRTGLDPATWALAMRPSLFYILTACWPCSYLSYKCDTNGNDAVGSFDMGDAIALRDAMRTGSYLIIDGMRVPVIQDDAIAEVAMGNGTIRSEIYFVPMTVLGGTPVTYMEYFDYTTPNGLADAARAFAPDGFFDVSDGGRFAWHRKPPNNWCVQLLAKTEPRLLLLTPYIAARLTNVDFTPNPHERAWDPGDDAYFVNGGTYSGQPTPSYYSPSATTRASQ